MNPRPNVLTWQWTVAPETVHSSRCCLWCGRQLTGRQRDYCTPSHRKMANRLKWEAALGAVVDVLRQWTAVDASALLTAVTLAFDWCAETGHPERLRRRADLMTALGLHWVAEAKRWERGL